MSKKVYVTSIKAVFRSPVTWISFIAVLAFFARLVAKEPMEATTYNFHEALAGYASSVLELAVPLFVSVVASVDILGDARKRFKDIVSISGTSQLKYYCSKICAYISVGLAASFLLSYAYFFIRFFQYDMLSGVDYSLAECLLQLAVRWFAYSVAVIPVYVSLSVCASLLCRSSIPGIVLPTAYIFIRYFPIDAIRIDGNFLCDYVYHLPRKILLFFYFFHTKARQAAIVPVEIREVALSYLLLSAICALLLTAGYLAYKKIRD